jgi:hypothetical protein
MATLQHSTGDCNANHSPITHYIDKRGLRHFAPTCQTCNRLIRDLSEGNALLLPSGAVAFTHKRCDRSRHDWTPAEAVIQPSHEAALHNKLNDTIPTYPSGCPICFLCSMPVESAFMCRVDDEPVSEAAVVVVLHGSCFETLRNKTM